MNDLISRQAAIDAVMNESREVDSRYLESERIIHECDAVEVLSLLPSAEPERHGRWIRIAFEDQWGVYACSECGICAVGNHFNYCPNCGAKMVGEQE